MPVQCQVELDIFSGMPNPTWSLTGAEAEGFLAQLATLVQIPAREMSGRLGYRGLIVTCRQDGEEQLIRVHEGAVQISSAAAESFAADKDRGLERWLLTTGKPHIEGEIFQMADREVR